MEIKANTTDRDLARQLLGTPTGCCTSNAYALFNRYRMAADPALGPTDAEVWSNLLALAEYPPDWKPGETVEEKAPHVGMSIRASGVAESGTKRDGVPVLKVVNLPRSRSISNSECDGEVDSPVVIEDYLQYLVEEAVRTEPDGHGYEDALKRLSNPRTLRLLHVGMGLVTEAAEFVDQLKKHIFYGKPLDFVNLDEELGDSSWYMRIGCDALESKFLNIIETNVKKLRARFPEKFSESHAINRDLGKERDVLEKGQERT